MIDIGSTYTKVAAVDIKGQCIIGAAQSYNGGDRYNRRLFNALGMLRKVTGTNKYCEKYACSSAAGGLK